MAKKAKGGLRTQRSVIGIMLVFFSCLSLIECGMVTNAELNNPVTWHNIWTATKFWRHPSVQGSLTPSDSSSATKLLIGSANIRYVKINTRRLVEGQNLQITLHAQISGQVHDFFLSPNIAVLQFNHLPITEKEDIDADAAIRKNQSAMRITLQTTLHPPPDVLTLNMGDGFQLPPIRTP